MTQNQINYAKVREEQRHNLATEGYSAIELQETQRHNVAGEVENMRHNTASEQINWYGASESARHNVQTEGLNWYLAPHQAKEYGARANYYGAQASAIPKELDLKAMQYDLSSKIADMDWYKIYYGIANEQERNRVAAREADTAAQRVTAEVEKWLRDYDFEVYQYDKTGRAKAISETVRNYVASGKDATSIASAIIDIINKLQDRAKRNDLIPDDWQTFSTYN